MNSNTTSVQNVSDTAFWVATYRAIESKRKNPLFLDPLAEILIGEHGEKVSNSMKPFMKYAYWSVTIRTRLIDDYILKYVDQGYKTIINLGAGLDTRPYRLSLPQDVEWIEVDFPAVIDLKNEKLKDHKPNCKLERIGLDLSHQEEREKLFSDLNSRVGNTLVLTEGVIPYLNEDSVSSLAKDIKAQPNFKLWLSEYYAPEVYPRFQSQKFKGRLGGSPFQFFPANWFSFFEECGWVQKEIQYLYDEAEKYGRNFPLPRWVSILKFIFGKERILKGVRKVSAYIVFEKK